MKILSIPFVIALASGPAIAQDSPAAIYQQYERTYLANDAKAMARWLAPDADLSQTLHVGDKSDTHHMSSAQLLESMRNVGRPASFPVSSLDKVVVSDTTDLGFCATTETSSQTVVGGQRYREREVRKACFVRGDKTYLVKSHSTDVFYTPAP